MKSLRHRISKGFSLVELLAVVLILSVLAAAAIPLYLNTRKVAAARACKGNIAAIASAESAFVLRYGAYTSMTGLLAAPEALATTPTCPLDGATYTIKDSAGTAVTTYNTAAGTGGTALAVTIACPNAGTATTGHMQAQATATNGAWNVTMTAISTDPLP